MPAPIRRTKAFTILEVVVVLVLIGILIAFVLPKLSGSGTYASDSAAQTTASGALDSSTQLWQSAQLTSAGNPADGLGCAASSPPSANRDSSKELTGPTNCPSFVNTTSLQNATGDVTFVTGDSPSTGTGVASVAGYRDSGSGLWKVAVAVLSPDTGNGVASCMMAWHAFPGTGGGADLEEYFAVTAVAPSGSSASPSATASPSSSDSSGPVPVPGCQANNAFAYDTGNPAVPMHPTPMDTYCYDHQLGDSWRRPCPEYLPASS